MVLHLAERLEVPLRERNELLLAAGYAPRLRRALARRPRAGARSATRSSRVLRRPRALPGDRGRPLLEPGRRPTRRSAPLLEGVAPRAARSRRSTASASRCTPTGSRRGSSTSASGARHLLERLDRPARLTGDPARASCTRRCWPTPVAEPAAAPSDGREIVVELRLAAAPGDRRAGVLQHASPRSGPRSTSRCRELVDRGVLPGRRDHGGDAPGARWSAVSFACARQRFASRPAGGPAGSRDARPSGRHTRARTPAAPCPGGASSSSYTSSVRDSTGAELRFSISPAARG